VLRRAAAAEDDGVAGLEAEGGRVDCDVGPRFVDHGDHAEGHADPAQVDAVGELPPVDDLPYRIRQSRHATYGGHHVADAVLVEQETVDEGVREPVGTRQAYVLLVLAHDLAGTPLESLGDGPEDRVLALPGKRPEHAGRAPRRPTDVFDAHGTTFLVAACARQEVDTGRLMPPPRRLAPRLGALLGSVPRAHDARPCKPPRRASPPPPRLMRTPASSRRRAPCLPAPPRPDAGPRLPRHGR